jgi:hypothetical protein
MRQQACCYNILIISRLTLLYKYNGNCYIKLKGMVFIIITYYFLLNCFFLIDTYIQSVSAKIFEHNNSVIFQRIFVKFKNADILEGEE